MQLYADVTYTVHKAKSDGDFYHTITLWHAYYKN